MKHILPLIVCYFLIGCTSILNDLQNNLIKMNKSLHDTKQGGESGKESRAANSYDLHLSQEMYVDLPTEFKDKYTTSVWSNALSFKHKYFSKSNLDPMLRGGPFQEIESNYSSYDSTEDEIAKRYYDAVAKRGGKIKLYQPQVNHLLSRSFSDNSASSRNRYYDSWDMAVIEFSRTGRMKSALVRNHYISTETSTKFHDMYSYVMMGPIMRKFEKTMSLYELNKYLISEFTPTL